MSNTTATHDDTAIINAMWNDGHFSELPVAFNTIDENAIAEMVVSITTSGSNITIVMRREEMTALSWKIVYGKLLKWSTIDEIDTDDHMCVVSWADTEGTWHRTLEGDMLASLLDVDPIDLDLAAVN